jgi:hypothetical protein
MKSAKYFEEGLFKVLMFISSLVIVAVLGLIIYSIMAKGLRVLSWEMISQTPKGGFYLGREGGYPQCHHRFNLPLCRGYIACFADIFTDCTFYEYLP